MSSISPITQELNNAADCNANNCCDRIDALDHKIDLTKTIVEGEIRVVEAIASGIRTVVEAEVHGVESLVNTVANAIRGKPDRGELDRKPDRGELDDTNRIARQALSIAQRVESEIGPLVADVENIKRVLPIISRNADSALALSNQALAKADRVENLGLERGKFGL